MRSIEPIQINNVFRLLQSLGYCHNLAKYAMVFVDQNLRDFHENNEKHELQEIANSMLDHKHESFYEYYDLLLTRKKLI